MPDVALIDLLLRGAAIGCLVASAAIFALRGRADRKHMAVALLCLSLCAYVLVSAPGALQVALGGAGLLLVIAGVIPVLVYWAALELFHDSVEIGYWQIGLAVLTVGLSWATLRAPELGLFRGICVLVLFGHMLLTVLLGRQDDLVEERRKFRSIFLFWMAGFGIVITGFELTHLDQGLPAWAYALQAAAIGLTVLIFLIWAVTLPPDIWRERRADQGTNVPDNPARQLLMQRIEAEMAKGVWRQEGLTITRLAQAMETPEHRLRAAINQGLGYRNFASFLNSFRIREAQAMLAAPEHADQTVLSIAYAVGFASLGPYNRAFRQQTGMTPTAFRRQSLAEVVKDGARDVAVQSS